MLLRVSLLFICILLRRVNCQMCRLQLQQNYTKCRPYAFQTFFNDIKNDKYSLTEENYAEKRTRLQKYTQKVFDSGKIQLGYLAICIVAKDEHQNIREWIQYHLWMGVSKIYLYDNGSHPPMISVLQDYADAGTLEYTYYTHSHEADDFELIRKSESPKMRFYSPKIWHYWAYDSCLHHYGHRHKFVGLFDVDEFLILTDKKSKSLPEFLKKFENFGGVVVYRRFFGSSGHIQRPGRAVLESYTKCTDRYETPGLEQFLPKTIVNMKFYDGHCSIHYCKTKKSTVNSLMQLDSAENLGLENNNNNINNNNENYQYKPNITWANLRFNHYYTKSFDVQLKFQRLYGNDEKKVQRHVRDFFNLTDKLAVANCLEGIELSKKCCSNQKQQL